MSALGDGVGRSLLHARHHRIRVFSVHRLTFHLRGLSRMSRLPFKMPDSQCWKEQSLFRATGEEDLVPSTHMGAYNHLQP